MSNGKVVLDVELLNKIMQVIGEMPYSKVADLMGEVRGNVQLIEEKQDNESNDKQVDD